jgi:hypothetical protein
MLCLSKNKTDIKNNYHGEEKIILMEKEKQFQTSDLN